jgi:hypothetical protein
MGDAGQTLIKMTPGSGFVAKALKMQSTSQTTTLFEVRKDVSNSAALNASTTVVLKYDADTAILKAYNAKKGTTFIPLPPALCTLNPAITNGSITINFNAGEFAKSVMLTIPNILNFDFSKKYALAFELKSVTGEGSISEGSSTQLVIQIMAANKYDGKYVATGTFVDYVGGPTWTGIYPKNVHLITRGLNSVDKYDADYDDFGYIFDAGGASGFGNWEPYFVFDDQDNVIDVVNAINDPLPRHRTAVLYTGPGAAANKFNAKDHSLDVSYQMKQETTSPQLRNLIIEHYEYKGPR